MGAIANLQPFFNHTCKGHEGSLSNPFIGQWNLSTTELNRFSATDQKTADIDLLTAEGDRVTISVKSLLEESYTGYDSMGYMNGTMTRTQMETFSSFSEREMLITLEGDLNEEELADIQKVLGKIESLAGDFFAGEIDEALAKAIQFDDLGSVVNLQASLQHTHSISMEQQYTAKIEESPSELPETVTGKERPITGNSVRKLIDEMTKAVQGSKVKPGKMAKALPKFIDHLFDKRMVENDPDGPKKHLAKLIKSELLQALPKEVMSDKLTGSDKVDDLTETEEESLKGLETSDPLEA